ncbi:energy transducer TonB [Aquimarina sp. AD10]|uniref:energy transducer TonB family protein n=1 Tax=Aquimarina sp. AD10 TaxID=1714849 RepID=UPI000E4A5B86|nr:energy transducer TonB [Aquimarina sp. AD10]AXT62227.1 energy transducer TonB [Aquimarina sp. AD10]RKM90578.1 TonB family protein [Aquimarina sp. AD10]
MIKKQKAQSEILMEIPEEFLAEQEEELEEEEVLEEDRQLIASKRTHSAFNEDFENHDEIEQRIKSLTESEEQASQEVEETQINEGDVAIDEKTDNIDEQKEEATSTEETNNRNSSLTYSLKNRKSVELPNPVYTCEGSGRVVVKIEVNKNGYVTNTKVDKKRSTTRNECLFDNAMEYARKALFSRTTIEKQEGTITYYFNYSN